MTIYPSSSLLALPLLLSITASATGTTGNTFSCRIEVPRRTSNIILEGTPPAARYLTGNHNSHAPDIYIQSAPAVDNSTIIRCTVNLPRGGGGDTTIGLGGTSTTNLEDETEFKERPSIIEHHEHHHEQEINKSNERNLPSRNRRHKLPLPKRLLNVARNLVGRTATILRLTPPSDGDELDHSFDELDRIIENNANTTTAVAAENNEKDNAQQQANEEGDAWLETWPPLPQAASLLNNGRKRRALSSWINKMELKFLSTETAKALGTIRNIVDAFPDYGVVDLFGMYSPKDVIWSIVALSRLQHVLESDYRDDDTNNASKINNNDANNQNANITIVDKHLLEELAHYCTFANAAYGWKGRAFCGRWHIIGGNNRVLVRSTGIDKRDIVTTNWHSKANRPAYYIARDRNRKAIVLGIRGSLSPRDILTDLCASSENFIVEDDPQIGSIGEENGSARPPPPPPLIVGRAHKGMVDAARSVARMTGKTISDELDAHPDFSLVIVGHSLGGGVAAVLAAMWKRRFLDRVRSIGYGNPCVFPLNITRDFESNIITVMGIGDPFATISLGHLADVTKALSKLCQDRGLREEILKRTGVGLLMFPNKDTTREDYEWCANAMAFLRKLMDSEKLLPPGKIYQMSGPLLDFQTEGNIGGRMGGDTTMLKPVDAMVFNELKLHARMLDVSLHIPMRYEMVLRRLVPSEV